MKQQNLISIANACLVLTLCIGHANFSMGQSRIKINHTDQKAIRLKVFYPNTTTEDTLILFSTDNVQKILTNNFFEEKMGIKSVKGKDGAFDFIMPAGRSPYTHVILARLKRQSERKDTNAISQESFVGEEILTYYAFKNGDNLVLQVSRKGNFEPRRGYRHNFSLRFSGKGAETQNFWYGVDSIDYHVRLSPFTGEKHTYLVENYENKIIADSKRFLENHKNHLSQSDYLFLLAHATFKAKKDEAYLITRTLEKALRNYSNTERKAFQSRYDSAFHAAQSNLPPEVLRYSMDYPQAEYYKKCIHAILTGTFDYRDSLFEKIRSGKPGLLRDQLLVQYFAFLSHTHPGAIGNLHEALTLVRQGDYKTYLNSLTFGPGSPAFDFDLPDKDGRRVRLSDFRGKVVLIDFWYTGCGNCLYYYRNELSKVEEHFKNDTSVVFLTISIDRSKALWIKSIQARQYTSGDVINLYTDGAGNNHDVIKRYGVFGYPRPVLIGKDQRILKADHNLRSAPGIIASIRGAK